MDQPFSKLFVIWGLAVSAGGGAVVAQAASQGPSLYGKINVSLESAQFDGAGNIVQGKSAEERDQWEINSNGSRLGVKGSFDLDDSGLTTIYLAEYEINVDDGGTGDSAFSQRNIYAGLRGGFGEIRYGKFDTPLKVAEGKIDQFNDLHGDIDTIVGGQNWVNNIVQYSTPLLASYGISEGRVSDEQGSLASVGIDYAPAAQANVFAYWSSLNLDNAELQDRTFGIGTSYTF